MANATIDLVAAMATPALLIVGAASLVASALVRMARVVDRARALATSMRQDPSDPTPLRLWLERHARRARYVERSILLLYGAVVLFIATSVAIGFDRLAPGVVAGLPAALALAGVLLLLAGGAWMVAETRLAGRQIAEEIALALGHVEERR